jgi:hypothetical protein
MLRCCHQYSIDNSSCFAPLLRQLVKQLHRLPHHKTRGLVISPLDLVHQTLDLLSLSLDLVGLISDLDGLFLDLLTQEFVRVLYIRKLVENFFDVVFASLSSLIVSCKSLFFCLNL